ncbi:MAG: hypothetical protein HC837_08355 [Chloroflexaceae bacterium]|nr:hypothetical protein [Chloroflexaceae bacterium]
MKYLTLIVALIVVVLLTATMMTSQPAAQAEGLTLEPIMPSVRAGETIEFLGSGFRNNERVSNWATMPNQAVLGGDPAYATDGRGSVLITFKIPSDAPGGTWWLTARGDGSGETVTTSFLVEGASTEYADFYAGVEPEVADPGMTLAFAATGFHDRERVSYWVTRPDGQIEASYHHGARADHDGRIDFTWVAPTDAMAGRWVMTMQGVKSHNARAVTFEMR